MMAESQSPANSFVFTGLEPGHLHSVEPLSDLHPRPRPCHPHLPLPPHHASGWRPVTVGELNAWNTSPQGMFPSALVGPSQNPAPLPHPQPIRSRTPPHLDAAATNNSNLGKRKRAARPNSITTSLVGGYGPFPPERNFTGASSSSPPSPLPPSNSRQNTACELWAFAQLLESNAPIVGQWPVNPK